MQAIVGSLVTSMAHSTSNLVAAADLEFGTKAAAMTKRTTTGEVKLRPSLGWRRLCYGLVVLAFAAFVVFASFQPARQIGPSNQTVVTVSPIMIPSYWQHEKMSGAPLMHIEDVVTFDSGEVLVLLRLSPGATEEFPTKDRLECRFGDRSRVAYTSPLALQKTQEDHRAALLCAPPPTDLTWDVNSLLIELDQTQEIEIQPHKKIINWSSTNLVVYESFSTDDDVVVFIHGMNISRGAHLTLHNFQCVFDDEIETAVTSQAQEVFRCAHPPRASLAALAGKKVTLKFNGRLLPSVAHYNSRDPKLMKTSHEICACTMIYNGAKFLNEWVYYHSHLGVSKFFLYDNNSDDDLEETISSLNDRSFNVVKQPWPWVKTQEAGFSHCALLANPECEWMLFIDVDEYFFPNRRFLTPRNESHLTTFIREAVGENSHSVGQIMTFCHNYGPSGLAVSPPQGVTQGYTCRMARPERHKSIVKLDAVATNLSNVIHHFSLQEGYQTVKIRAGVGVINHYKFQVWDEFKVKFRRRAATYVADWTENRNHASKDRVPDLGTRAVKPLDWEKRFCEVWDYELRNYTRRVFGNYDGGSLRRLRLAWEPAL